MNKRKKSLLFFCLFLLSCTAAFADVFPAVRYVAARDGLNLREAASASSNRLGALLYGSRIVVHERSGFTETIAGITDYWYRSTGGGFSGWFWVFGGFLSASMPDDTAAVLGLWNTDRGARYFWSFRPDHFASTGRRETSGDWIGTWALAGNSLTIITTPTEHHPRGSETMAIMVRVINRDHIILRFADGRQESLSRSNTIF